MSPFIPPSGLDRVDGRNVRDDAELLRVGRGSQWDEGTNHQDNPDPRALNLYHRPSYNFEKCTFIPDKRS